MYGLYLAQTFPVHFNHCCVYCFLLLVEFSLFSYNNGMVMSSCRELDNNRSALSAASAFAIATAGANEGTPTKEKYRRMSLASTGVLLSLF